MFASAKLFYLFNFYWLVFCKSETDLNVSLSQVWGPGLRPDLYRLPARYFFISTVNSNNESIQIEKSQINVVLQGISDNGKKCRVWVDVLDRKDGIFIVRYRLYEMCAEVSISVQSNNLHLAQSPYKVTGLVYPEDCNCPQDNLEDTISSWKCGEIPKQIQDDLFVFKKVDWRDIRGKVIQQYNSPGAISLCHYVIKDNVIYNKCYGQHVGFRIFIDSMLLSLSRKFFLPDLEFFMNLGDYPLVGGDQGDIFPIFSWCGSTQSFDIVLPTYDISESTLENMGKVMLDMLSIQGNANLEWDKRIPKLFWRGRDSNKNRLKLIQIARENPDLFNASLTNFFFYRDLQDVYGPKVEHISFFKFFDYKFQISVDGTVAAYRMPYLLAGGSVVLKQESIYYEHFYNLLMPYVHYVPVNEDLSNLVEKLQMLIDHDENAQKIANSAKKFANEHLLPVNIYCYYAMLLNEFSKRIISPIQVLQGMEQVTQPEPKSPCVCRNHNKRDEL